ncbi:Down syndrome cell adhesion molecule-like protein Dscam2 [Eufriesea mexicana]|nr:Down syndrome cell adhesion molecule-like protein Dscam2 [Eufriesea mexicana]
MVAPPEHPGDTPGDYRELGYSGTEGAGVAGNGSLAIPRVSRDHAGFYLCQASNGIGPGLSKLIRLTVHAGPQVSVKTRQESVRRGESVTLRCEAEGDAPLDLSWRARDSRVDPNYDVRYTIDNQKVSGRVISELRITQANHIDRGDYMCVATNAYGHARANINLLVQEPPNFPRNLHVAEQGSRSLLLAWSSPSSEQDPAHASSPITNYIVQYKEAQEPSWLSIRRHLGRQAWRQARRGLPRSFRASIGTRRVLRVAINRSASRPDRVLDLAHLAMRFHDTAIPFDAMEMSRSPDRACRDVAACLETERRVSGACTAPRDFD